MIPERRSVLHSWCVQADWDAPEIVGGEGAWFWDDHGRRYLDMSSLAECMSLGHQHPALVRAIQEQAGKLSFMTSDWGAEPGRRGSRSPPAATSSSWRRRWSSRRRTCWARSP